ncbi:MAG: hypothetical protein IT425_14100 [Pirellulales bacterium]|nr:hypothetical protein [Pirellulales bacterium]
MNHDAYIVERTEEILARQHQAVSSRTDRAFAVLFVIQWVAAILFALPNSSSTWHVGRSHLDLPVWTAASIGLLLSAVPIAAVLANSGAASTRWIITVAQMLYSCLFIHLSGGRIESHFHIFASLAFLAFYRDWRLFIPATLVVAINLLAWGFYWPESVFGLAAFTPWRALEHLGWVLVEAGFLAWGCVRTKRDLQTAAAKQAELELANAAIEMSVEARTAELRDRSERLEAEVQHRAQLESQLAQSQKLEAIGQLAAGIAHEINTPMQFVCDNIEYLNECSTKLFEVVDHFDHSLAEGTPVSWEDRRRELQNVIGRNQFYTIREQVPLAIHESLEGARRVIEIVRAMKEFSHLGQQQRTGVDLNNAIQSTVTISRNRWKYYAEIELVLDPNLPTVNCIPSEINQVLLNLIVNAGDAIGERIGESGQDRGVITIRTRRESDHVAIEVSDTGCGIPDTIRKRIFDPFFTTKDVGKGSGQGLAICYNIVVNKHHGEIEVESTVGVGSTFRIRLPLIPQADETEAPASTPDETLEAFSDALIDPVFA